MDTGADRRRRQAAAEHPGRGRGGGPHRRRTRTKTPVRKVRKGHTCWPRSPARCITADLPCPLLKVTMMRKSTIFSRLCLRIVSHEQVTAPSSFRFVADPLLCRLGEEGEFPLHLLPQSIYCYLISLQTRKEEGENWHGGAGCQSPWRKEHESWVTGLESMVASSDKRSWLEPRLSREQGREVRLVPPAASGRASSPCVKPCSVQQ